MEDFQSDRALPQRGVLYAIPNVARRGYYLASALAFPPVVPAVSLHAEDISLCAKVFV